MKTMKKAYTLWDTFNDRPLSRHRSIETAVRAKVKHDRFWAKQPGGSYIPADIRDCDGGLLEESERDEASRMVYEAKNVQ